jgi:hypothetical protein
MASEADLYLSDMNLNSSVKLKSLLQNWRSERDSSAERGQKRGGRRPFLA